MAWTAERLPEWLETFHSGDPIVVLANRQPLRAPDGSIVVTHSASGLVTAVERLIRAWSEVWVAHGAGTADGLVVDRRDRLDVPPANPLYWLRRVWLDADEERVVLSV
jgi:trehalose 6-phosphate synthase